MTLKIPNMIMNPLNPNESKNSYSVAIRIKLAIPMKEKPHPKIRAPSSPNSFL